MNLRWPSVRTVQAILIVCAMASAACQSFRSHAPTAADSAAVVTGELLDTSGQGNQFYGSVVYLIATPTTFVP